MAKQDQSINENVDHKNEDERETSGPAEYKDREQDRFTEVKNANASGLGSMGRNEENLRVEKPGNQTTETGQG